MAEVVLFHHLQGLTDGVRAFAGELRAGGHIVHTPDLFDGQRPASIDDSAALVESIGDEVLSERADRAVAGLPGGLVYAGFSYGVIMPQRLAQTRPGARGALLYEACLPVSGPWAIGPWPSGHDGEGQAPKRARRDLGNLSGGREKPETRTIEGTARPRHRHSAARQAEPNRGSGYAHSMANATV